MINSYLFHWFCVKFFKMQIRKNFFITLFSCSFLFAQTLQVDDATLSSGGGYVGGTTLGITETDVTIYSNAMVHNLYVWGIPWYSETRTFPARIDLPLDNRSYVISLYKKSHYKAIALELQTFDFDNRPLEEFEFLQRLNADLAIVVAYGQIIPKEILELSKYGFINIHASLLPKLRGAAPIQRSIMNLDVETGISIMKINEELDSGPISNICLLYTSDAADE